MALQTSAGFAALNQIKDWMMKSLQYSFLRVNTLRTSPEQALKRTQHWLERVASLRQRPTPKAWIHPAIKEAIVVSAWPDGKQLLEPHEDKKDLPVVIIDSATGSAVLRGAPVFKSGLLAASDNISENSEVRIDVRLDGHRQWIGYGVVRSLPQSWEQPSDSEEGVVYDNVVEMTEGMSILPPVPRALVEEGHIIAQSLPSMITPHVLDPQPGQRILDFGAGTGVMSTHIAALTSNKAEIVAVECSVGRARTLVQRCQLLGAKVSAVCSSVEDFAAKKPDGFDRILVHPDHSSIGVRPSVMKLLHHGRSVNVHIREYVEIAVNLLKPGGRLVYCTGSLLPAENDAVIRWLLDRRQDLKLQHAEPRIAPVGVTSPLPCSSWMRLTPNEEKLVQRFGPNTPEVEPDPVNADVPGFFIACLTKVQ